MAAPERQLGEDDRAWLVKTGERILGPFTCAELKERLRKRELVAIDEVATPGRRWRFIRDEPRFAKVLEDLRKAQLNRVDDEGTGSASRTLTSAEDLTEATAVGFDPANSTHDEPILAPAASPAAGASSDGGASPWRLRAEEPAPASAAEPSRAAASEAQSSAARAYADDDALVQITVRRSSRAVTALTAALLASAVLAFVFQQRGRFGADESVSLGGKAASAAGMKAYRFGRFEDALRLLSDAEAANPSDAEPVLAYASLLARAEQTQLAKRKAEPFASSPNLLLRARALTVRAAASIADGDLPAAAADLEAALKASPGDSIALANLGVIAFRRKDWSDAAARFRDAAAAPTADAAPTVMLARALFASGTRAASAEAVDMLRALAARTWDLKQEAHLLLANHFLAAGDRAQARLEAIAAASADPFAGPSHWRDPALAGAPLSWARELAPICASMVKEGRDAPYRALQAICEQKAGRLSSASSIAADLIRRSPNDGLAHAASAFVALAQNDEASAEAALRIAFERAAADADDSALSLARALRGRICWKRQDLECARNAVERLAELAPPSPFALVVLAHEQMRRSQAGKARAILARARGVSRNFIPAMELEAELPK